MGDITSGSFVGITLGVVLALSSILVFVLFEWMLALVLSSPLAFGLGLVITGLYLIGAIKIVGLVGSRREACRKG